METSARNEVNIEETFQLLVRRVVEARRLAERGAGGLDAGNAHGMTKPLTPLASGRDNEKAAGDAALGGESGPFQGGFWRKLRCW
jgi:GTPase KRas protein